LEISTKVSQESFEARFVFAIEDGDSLVKEFGGNKETKRVRAKASKFKTEITGRFIEGEKDVDFRVVTKISGAYSREDEIGNRKEAYSYNDYVVELTGKSPKSGGGATLYMSIAGGYSVDTTPDVDCVEGVFNFKTIKPIKSSGQGYCGAESGEIEVNNAKMEFSSGKVKVSVDNQQKEYRCEELGGLCKYEPITIAEGVEQKPCPVWFKDKDKDGYTDGTTKVSCEKPSDEYVSSATAGDCNDADSSMNSGRTEICDNKDNNCNGQTDEGNVCAPASTFAKTISGSNDDEARSIIQSSDGSYVVAGGTGSFGAGGFDIYVVKLDSGGNVQWTKTIGGSDGDVANSIIQSSDGGYVVAGLTRSFGAGDYDFYVVKLDSSGNVIWTKTIGGSLTDVAWSIIQSSDGGYVVAGWTWSFGAGGSDIYVVKLDSGGNVQWAKTIGGSNNDGSVSFFYAAVSITQSSDGSYVVAGSTQSFGAGAYPDMYVVKMDANGNVCFSQNITNYSVSSTVGSFSSPSTVAISQSPTVNIVSPTVSSGGSVNDVCPSSPAPHLCSGSQDCSFSSAIASGEKEDVKSYGCSAGGVLSRFLIPASMLIVYGQLRKKGKKKKDGV
jgi:hypothetical protein